MTTSPDPSGNSTVLYFENSTLVGKRETYCCGYSNSRETVSGYWPNTAFFCPTCGEIWARAVYDHHFQYQPAPQASWITEGRRCPQHGDGTFLSGYSDQHLSSCSTELLHREALILCLTNPTKELTYVP